MGDEASKVTERQVEVGVFMGDLTGRARAHAAVYLEDRSFFVDIAEGVETVFGRSEEVTVQIPTPTMSRSHFALRFHDGRLTGSDCGSMNGTYLNGEKLTGEAELSGGDQITAGAALVVVGITSPQPLTQRIRPAEVFEQRLAAALTRASRLGRMLAMVRLHVQGSPEQAAQGLARVIGALPGRPLARAVGPLDFHLLVDRAVDRVRGLCGELAAEPEGAAEQLLFGVALFPREAQDATSLLNAADAALGLGTEAEAAPPTGPVAVDPATVRVFSLVERVAASEGTVLIVGETGVGKEVVARAIHDQSARAGGPFIPVNCGAIPSTMFASELFGHERGAFTGAVGRRTGLFEAANGGTLFLDEVGEIPLADQAHLLRAIETRAITRLGGNEPQALDLRILAATNRPLRELARTGEFRQDLLYRLDVLAIVIPALRDRRGDIAPLARRFLAEIQRSGARPGANLSPEALSVLEKHSWPGNVRELRNAVERLVLLSTNPEVTETEATELLYGGALPDIDLQADTDLKTLLATVERAAIGRALEACGGNQTLAAQKLGISRRTLIYRMRSHGIPGPRTGG